MATRIRYFAMLQNVKDPLSTKLHSFCIPEYPGHPDEKYLNLITRLVSMSKQCDIIFQNISYQNLLALVSEKMMNGRNLITPDLFIVAALINNINQLFPLVWGGGANLLTTLKGLSKQCVEATLFEGRKTGSFSSSFYSSYLPQLNI